MITVAERSSRPTGACDDPDCRLGVKRINSRATALGIERPKARNARSVARLNTLTYIVITARALQRTRSLNAAPSAPLPNC